MSPKFWFYFVLIYALGWKRDPIYHKYVNQMREIPDYAARRRVEAKNLKREYADVRLGEMEEWRQELDRAGLKKPSPIKTPQREPSIIPPPDIPVKVGPETNNTPTTAKAKALQTPNAAYTPYSPINTTTPSQHQFAIRCSLGTPEDARQAIPNQEHCYYHQQAHPRETLFPPSQPHHSVLDTDRPDF